MDARKERDERLARALRENLKRRKSQARGRKADGGGGGDATAGNASPAEGDQVAGGGDGGDED